MSNFNVTSSDSHGPSYQNECLNGLGGVASNLNFESAEREDEGDLPGSEGAICKLNVIDCAETKCEQETCSKIPHNCCMSRLPPVMQVACIIFGLLLNLSQNGLFIVLLLFIFSLSFSSFSLCFLSNSLYTS